MERASEAEANNDQIIAHWCFVIKNQVSSKIITHAFQVSVRTFWPTLIYNSNYLNFCYACQKVSGMDWL